MCRALRPYTHTHLFTSAVYLWVKACISNGIYCFGTVFWVLLPHIFLTLFTLVRNYRLSRLDLGDLPDPLGDNIFGTARKLTDLWRSNAGGFLKFNGR